MGWFDKKSWQLRRKIRDLQAELATAERDGKYLVEQGLFFAELQEMGDQTLMVLGTADHLDSEEEAVIRNFLGRNGFAVEHMRLDKAQKTLASVEIIPPQELTRRVAKQLKEAGYRLIDDSDHERASEPEKKRLTLSGLIRAISALFATHVHQLIINNDSIKMNMEGNRLLHWMPLMRDALVPIAGTEVVNICREPFVNAYNHYYGQLGRMERPEELQHFAEEPATIDLLETATVADETTPLPHNPFDGDHGENSPEEKSDIDRVDSRADSRALRAPEKDFVTTDVTNRTVGREAETAFALASVYKSLIGSSNQRRVRNAEIVLDAIARFFSASSACLLSRRNADSEFMIQSNSSGPHCVRTNGEGTVCADTTSLEEALTSRQVVVVPGSGNGSHNPQAVIVPLALQGAAAAVLYLSEPSDFRQDGPVPDTDNFALLARVFREFPDLLIADFTEKDETAAVE